MDLKLYHNIIIVLVSLLYNLGQDIHSSTKKFSILKFIYESICKKTAI